MNVKFPQILSLFALLCALFFVTAGPVFAQDENAGTSDETTANLTEDDSNSDSDDEQNSDDEGSEKESADDDTTADTSEAEEPQFNQADIAWMLVATAFVLMMSIPGLALFYGGLVRKKNVLSIMMQCIFLAGIMSIVWVLWGYSLAFAPGLGGSWFVGGFDHVLLNGVLPYMENGEAVVPGSGIPDVLFMVFQMTFFIITPALIVGAFAERMKFSAMVLFSILWGTFVYCPICHWVWASDGWLLKMEALDFAGGTVVHISSGVSALVCALLLGKRLGYGQEPMPPHNLTYTFIGTAMLWVGWFGFNAGSALSAGTAAVNAFACTHVAAAAGCVAWAGMEWILRGKPSILGACSGAVAGLVCITPASGTATVLGGICIGLAGGIASFYACTALKSAFGYDDTLDVFGVHGVSGLVGALLTGVFAAEAIGGAPGVLEGNPGQMVPQVVSVLAAIAIAAVGSVIILKVLDVTIGLRVEQDGEIKGIDLSEHGEEGYIFL